jgi:hypothetical protein
MYGILNVWHFKHIAFQTYDISNIWHFKHMAFQTYGWHFKHIISRQVRHVDRPERDELGDGLVVAVADAIAVARRRPEDVLDRRDDFRRRERGENDFRKNSGNQFGFREKVSVPQAAERTGRRRGFPESGRFR